MPGVYRIRNLKTGKIYVGGTTQTFSERWGQHKSKLESGTHANHGLQSDWNTHGEAGFAFEVLEPTEMESVPAAEQRWLDKLFDSGTVTYNIAERTTFPKDGTWYREKKMARRDSFFRGWGMRPGRYERKESNIRTDWLMPILQGLACVMILFLDLLFLGSWFFILPPEVDWALGMILFWSVSTSHLTGVWVFIRLWPFSCPLNGRAAAPGYISYRLRKWQTWIPCIMIEVGILLSMWFYVWEWWWEKCLLWPDIALPIPSTEGVTTFFLLGVFVGMVGMIGIVLHPSKYALGLTAFGGAVSAAANWFSPVSVSWARERPLLFYALWAAWCFAFVVGTLSLYYRLFLLEICDPYQPHEDGRKMPAAQDFPTAASPGSAEGQTSGM